MMFFARPNVGSRAGRASLGLGLPAVPASESPSRFSPPIRINSRREIRSHSV